MTFFFLTKFRSNYRFMILREESSFELVIETRKMIEIPMSVVFPSTETQVNAANERNRLIDNDHFLVVRPKVHARRGMMLRVA